MWFFLGLFLLFFLIVYGFLRLASIRKYKTEYGISFSAEYANSLGFSSKEVYMAMLKDLRPKYVRIAAIWNNIEKERGAYDFSELDWFFDRANEYGAKITLVVGQKAPRWPECYIPEWWEGLPTTEQKSSLLTYVEIVVTRYKDHPALEMWQVENEPFIRFEFGGCANFVESFVHDEIALVKKNDPKHAVLVTDSGELGFWRKAAKAGDVFGTTLYRVVGTPYGFYFSYDFLPPAFYRFKAFFAGRVMNNVLVSELQMEPWFITGSPLNVSAEEQEKSMNPKRMERNFDYTERIGFSRAYLWGVEWWYFMKNTQKNDWYWERVREKLP